MATKTLTITKEAYDELKAMKMGDESFSKTILRLTEGKKGLPEGLLGAWKGTNMSEEVRNRRLLD